MARAVPTLWDIRPAATARWAEAEVLLGADRPWGAHCLIGLSVEQAMKAWCLENWVNPVEIPYNRPAKQILADMLNQLSLEPYTSVLATADWSVAARRSGGWVIRGPEDGQGYGDESLHSVAFWARVVQCIGIVKQIPAHNFIEQADNIWNLYSITDRYMDRNDSWNTDLKLSAEIILSLLT